MRLSRRDVARLAGAAVASSGFVLVSGSGLAEAQTPESASRDSSPNEDLLDLLTFVPLKLVEENYAQGYELATFGDGALRLASVGVEAPASISNTEDLKELFPATLPVPYGTLAQASVRAEDSLSLFGWTFADIQQTLYTMTEGGSVHVMRGTFDSASIEAAWSANGYEMIEVEGQVVASVGADREIDLTSELSRLALSSANNAALLDDGTLIYSAALDALTAMLQAHAGDLPSLGADAMVRSVVGAITDPLSGAMLLPAPAFLAPVPFDVGEEVVLDPEDLPEPGPVPLMGLVGFVSGSSVPESDFIDIDSEPVPSGSKMVAALHYLTADEAAVAARRSLLTLESGIIPTTARPYAEYFAGWRVDHHAGSDTVTIEIDLYGNENIWSQMIYRRDAGFLYS